MALPGPAPKDNKVGRTPNADWTNVPNVPFEAGRSRELPQRYEVTVDDAGTSTRNEVDWNPQTDDWWDIVRTLPHAAIWTEADWLFATDTAYFKDDFYNGTANAADKTEMRRREDLMGLSAEARRKLRIRYTDVVVMDEQDGGTGGSTGNVTSIASSGARKRRQIAEV